MLSPRTPLFARINLTQLVGRRWTRTLLISVLVGLLCGLAARALETLIDVGFRNLIGRFVDVGERGRLVRQGGAARGESERQEGDEQRGVGVHAAVQRGPDARGGVRGHATVGTAVRHGVRRGFARWRAGAASLRGGGIVVSSGVSKCGDNESWWSARGRRKM